jgi:hypothetical protein
MEAYFLFAVTATSTLNVTQTLPIVAATAAVATSKYAAAYPTDVVNKVIQGQTVYY